MKDGAHQIIFGVSIYGDLFQCMKMTKSERQYLMDEDHQVNLLRRCRIKGRPHGFERHYETAMKVTGSSSGDLRIGVFVSTMWCRWSYMYCDDSPILNSVGDI